MLDGDAPAIHLNPVVQQPTEQTPRQQESTDTPKIEEVNIYLDAEFYKKEGERELVGRYLDSNFTDVAYFNRMLKESKWVMRYNNEFGHQEHGPVIFLRICEILKENNQIPKSKTIKILRLKYKRFLGVEMPIATTNRETVFKMIKFGILNWRNLELGKANGKGDVLKLQDRWKPYHFMFEKEQLRKINFYILNKNELFLSYFEFMLEMFIYYGKVYHKTRPTPESDLWAELQEITFDYIFFIHNMYQFPKSLNDYTFGNIFLDLPKSIPHNPKVAKRLIRQHNDLIKNKDYKKESRRYFKSYFLHPSDIQLEKWLVKDIYIPGVLWELGSIYEKEEVMKTREKEMMNDMKEVNLYNFMENKLNEQKSDYSTSLTALTVLNSTAVLNLGITKFASDYVVFEMVENGPDVRNSICNAPKIIDLSVNEFAVVRDSVIEVGNSTIFEVIQYWLQLVKESNNLKNRFPKDTSDVDDVSMSILTDYEFEGVVQTSVRKTKRQVFKPVETVTIDKKQENELNDNKNIGIFDYSNTSSDVSSGFTTRFLAGGLLIRITGASITVVFSFFLDVTGFFFVTSTLPPVLYISVLRIPLIICFLVALAGKSYSSSSSFLFISINSSACLFSSVVAPLTNMSSFFFPSPSSSSSSPSLSPFPFSFSFFGSTSFFLPPVFAGPFFGGSFDRS